MFCFNEEGLSVYLFFFPFERNIEYSKRIFSNVFYRGEKFQSIYFVVIYFTVNC